MEKARATPDWPRWRRWAAAAPLASLSLWIAAQGGPHDMRDPVFWLVLSGMTSAAIGIGRPSVLAQVFSRALAWVVFVPAAIVSLAALLSSSFDRAPCVLAAASGAALFFANPALFTKEAHTEFDPVGYRRWFLAGTIASVAAAGLLAFCAFASMQWGHHLSLLSLGALAASSAFLASALGVLRMRAWGVLLGVVTTLLSVPCALLASSSLGTAAVAWAALASVPGLMLAFPVLASRLCTARGPEARAFRPMQVEELRVRVTEEGIEERAGIEDSVADSAYPHARMMDRPEA